MANISRMSRSRIMPWRRMVCFWAATDWSVTNSVKSLSPGRLSRMLTNSDSELIQSSPRAFKAPAAAAAVVPPAHSPITSILRWRLTLRTTSKAVMTPSA